MVGRGVGAVREIGRESGGLGGVVRVGVRSGRVGGREGKFVRCCAPRRGRCRSGGRGADWMGVARPSKDATLLSGFARLLLGSPDLSAKTGKMDGCFGPIEMLEAFRG